MTSWAVAVFFAALAYTVVMRRGEREAAVAAQRVPLLREERCPRASSGSCPQQCSGRGRCVWNHCVCHAGFTGADCSGSRAAWEAFLEADAAAAIGPDADVRGDDVVERWQYMATMPFQARYVLAADFLASCTHILEVGGLTTPVLAFLPASSQARATNLDPLSTPMVKCYGASCFRRSLPQTWSEYQPLGDEDCWLAMGLHCDGLQQSLWTQLQGMRRIVVDIAAGPLYDACLVDHILPITTGPGWRTALDVEMDLRRSRDAGSIPSDTPDWRVKRRLLFFERL